MEKLNYSAVAKKLSTFDANCDVLYTALKTIDEAVSESIESVNGAIFGDLGKSLLRDWDDNCEMFLNFRGMFEEWRNAAVEICVANEKFEHDSQEHTAETYNLFSDNKSAHEVGNGQLGNFSSQSVSKERF